MTVGLGLLDTFNCQASAYATFGLASVGCIALAAVPFIGEVLVIPCTTAAVSQLAISLKQCAAQK